MLQVINLAPTTEVELHLVIDNAEERLGARMAELLAVVAVHAPAARNKAHLNGNGGES